jgi:flagellar hook-basal body complex protein FliE
VSVNGIEGLDFTPYVAPQLPTAADRVSGSSQAGADFGNLVLDGIDRLEGVQDRADKLAVQAATGDLDNIHDYTMAATEASVTAQLTVAVRNRALEAFNEIMRMPIG